jgi:CRISPR-associated endonuclease/helicase Cas3
MNRDRFDEFFKAATNGAMPYGYQCRLACGPHADTTKPDSLRNGADCKSQLINIPTGLGKTAAVVLAWLWNRVQLQDQKWPRRLVYCLPMRTLVEQTEEEVKKWLKNLSDKSSELAMDEQSWKDLKWLLEHSPIVLMGGEELDNSRREWDIYPEKPAILIGTQDMLLSRALNRGYLYFRAYQSAAPLKLHQDLAVDVFPPYSTLR